MKPSAVSPTPELELACVQAYNDWLIEEWAAVSPRFIPQCIVPLAPIEATVSEIKRAVAKGHRGVVMPSVPMMLREVPHINEPVYDPVWATCQDLDVPVCFHAGATRDIQFPPYAGFSPEVAAAMEAITRPVSSVLVVANFLFSRILERFPRLKVCSPKPRSRGAPTSWSSPTISSSASACTPRATTCCRRSSSSGNAIWSGGSIRPG